MYLSAFKKNIQTHRERKKNYAPKGYQYCIKSLTETNKDTTIKVSNDIVTYITVHIFKVWYKH